MPQTDSPEADARAARLELERILGHRPLQLPPGFADAVERFVALLLAANRRINLTRVTEPAAVARLHLLDALSALPLIDGLEHRARGLDLGSGGGVPGLVLALARPEQRWVLVDSVRKKADVLRDFVAALGVDNVEVIAERAEILGHDPAASRVPRPRDRACVRDPAGAGGVRAAAALGRRHARGVEGADLRRRAACRPRRGSGVRRRRAIGPATRLRRAGRASIRRHRQGQADAAALPAPARRAGQAPAGLGAGRGAIG